MIIIRTCKKCRKEYEVDDNEKGSAIRYCQNCIKKSKLKPIVKLDKVNKINKVDNINEVTK